ncbi:SAM-dependent methyltransferase [Phorcysia thermohydrogeniphila]|uniref:SAM-dependent MidA family methyltransferase n=1 Tax=Phorcysia thermohydrogeniphila TaxID=936138 RepID=A0A4R1GFI6_9BACT|nr:SAM-dependent methyltransferase [Phorcysia thermohydrogeniphila]TCK04589.1 SAM-dependent MidA family methyltransferase [Phorcysia thermohydrogeniphila]
MLKEIIRREIEKEGFITFDRFVELCLYHPEFGYYTTKRVRALPGEDFFTAPELSPVFGRTIAHHIERISREKDIPLNILELGGGKGFLAKDLMESFPVESYVILEKSEVAKELVPDVRVVNCVEEIEEFSGFVISNEFFDAFPFKRVVKREEKLWEVVVKLEGEKLMEDLIPYSGSLPCELEEGCEYSFFTGWEDFLERLFKRVRRGYFLTFDYGSSCEDLRNRKVGTFRAFSKHTLIDNYLEFPGRADLTSSVDFGYLRKILEKHLLNVSVKPLSSFLLSEGVERFLSPEDTAIALTLLVDMGRKFWAVSGYKEGN